jgi:exodeoxyribonuclease III
LRVVSWNLLHGGGARIPALVGALLAHEPDLCVLAEARSSRLGEVLEPLSEAGFLHHAATVMPARKNGVVVVSRSPITVHPPPPGEMYARRWVDIETSGGIRVVACHVPPKISIGVEQKLAFWQTLLGFAGSHLDEPAMIVGDLNTGAPYVDEHRATLYCAEQFAELDELGWVDAWRRFHGPSRKEWSWGSPTRPAYGYRLDHVFCTPVLAERLEGCRYSHEERHRRLSDHSIMITDVSGCADSPSRVSRPGLRSRP